MLSPSTEHLIKGGGEAYPTQSKSRKFILPVIFFLLGATVVFVPAIILYIKKDDCSSSTPSPVPRNDSDYMSNSDYYSKLSESHDFTQADNLRLDHLSSPQLHPVDGNTVIYLRKQYHMPDSNGSSTTLHWTDLKTNQTIQLTEPMWGINDQQFYWINNKTILFLSNRASSGLNQLYQLVLPNDISKLKGFITPSQITDFPLDIDDLVVNRQGDRIAFSCQVFSNLSIVETAKKLAADKASGTLVYKFDKLFIRHWDEYMLGPRHHPFIVSIKANGQGIYSLAGEPVDLLFGVDSDSPTRPFGSGKVQWSFSATSKYFAFTRQHDETSEVAWSTNLDIYTVDLSKLPKVDPVCITCDNKAADTDPSYSPNDDNILVYRAQAVPGYESDQFKIKLYKGSTERQTLLDGWDRSIQAIAWALDAKSLYLEIGEEARNVIYKYSDIFSSTSVPVRILETGSSHDVNIHPTNNNQFVFTHESLTEPANIYLYSDDSSRPLTTHNSEFFQKVRISRDVQIFNFTGALDEIVHGWYMAPVDGATPNSPLAFLIHGGPQNSWYDAWSYRWNYQAFAGKGYAVIAINFHGSDSYGQNFTDSITSNYGTYPFEDLQKGLEAAFEKYPYIARNRAAALGASYGGFMINFIAGQPELSTKFKTLVCHDGLFDMRGMAYSTEELWFSEHDAGGVTPYEHPEAFEKFNPVTHVANWSQPMLIIHGGRDYRVPDTQGIGAFTALQRRGIPSRLLYLPNENHWTVNPLNSLVWYQEVLDWMQRWTAA